MPSTTRSKKKLGKRKDVTSANKQALPAIGILGTRSDSALPIFKKVHDVDYKRLSRKENARRKAQDELVTLFGSKEGGSAEFNKKLSSYVKKFGKIEITDENSHIKENVRNLLITKKNEIDIERIVALHLLSIMPAKKCFRLQFIEEDLEEDDDDNRKLTRYSDILPNYIVVSDDLDHCDCFIDQNRKHSKSTFMHISINRQVEELLNATLAAIRKSNPSKLEMLWLVTFDTYYIRNLLSTEKFRYLLTAMKNNLKWLFRDNVDVKTVKCDLRDISFYGVNKYRDDQVETVFKITLPELIYKEILFDDRTKYHMRIAEIGLRVVKGTKYLLPEDGLCIFQYPNEPAGIIILAENGQFLSLINGPEFHYKNSDKFSNIALYVMFQSGIKDRSEDWKDIIRNKESQKQMDKDEIKTEYSNEKLNEATRKYIMKRIIKSLEKEERRIFASKYGFARKLAKTDENGEVKFAQILKEVISINRILRILSEFNLKERELAMKSSNYGGLGFARVIIGKNTMQLIKKMCNRDVAQLQVTPIHNTNLLDTELSKITLNIPENINIIYQEIYNIEHSKANKLFLMDFDTTKIKTFDV